MSSSPWYVFSIVDGRCRCQAVNGDDGGALYYFQKVFEYTQDKHDPGDDDMKTAATVLIGLSNINTIK